MTPVTERGRVYTAVLWPDRSDGSSGYVVVIPTFRGCVSQASSIRKAKNTIRGVARGYITDMHTHGELIPKDTGPGRDARRKGARIERVWVPFR
ncbi:MAG: type II toxin-antitoxin system HicB family antitoxin [bacterium]|nr:type II toxin-antitoxin system HicB family antitoxin [bacterium]